MNVAGGGGGGFGGGFGGGGGGIGGAGGGGGGGGGGGLEFITTTNSTAGVSAAVRNFFTTLGVILSPPKSVFWNDRKGELLVRAELQDLDIIEKAIEVLNIAPPQVNIKAKFVEVAQSDTKALGFDWYIGNFLMNNGAIGAQGGTAPSFQGTPTPANPLGTFPGNVAAGTAIAPASSDTLLTQGLRNGGVGNLPTPPAVATITGILTDPQFRVVIHALDQRTGADLLNQADVTTESGRQAHFEVSDIQTIVTGVATTSGTTALGTGVGTAGTAATVASGPSISYPTGSFPFGTTLDVIPYVSADGYTIQMAILPTVTEFLGYDDPGKFIPQVQAVSGTSVGIPLVGQLPLPRERVRQVTTSVTVWDGQTVVLGGLITETVERLKDQVPVLGSLPLVGRLFRSEQSASVKNNLIIFVTPTIIDAAGNRYFTEDELPFAQNSFPQQKPLVPNP